MTDRLAELRRQRSLISEHLAWLDREIGQIESAAAQPLLPLQPPTDAAVASVPSTEGPAGLPLPTRAEATTQAVVIKATDPISITDPEILLEKFRAPPDAVNRDVRRGCLLYFAGALVLLGIGVAILYFTIGSR